MPLCLWFSNILIYSIVVQLVRNLLLIYLSQIMKAVLTHLMLKQALSIVSVSLLAVESISDFSPLFLSGLLEVMLWVVFNWKLVHSLVDVLCVYIEYYNNTWWRKRPFLLTINVTDDAYAYLGHFVFGYIITGQELSIIPVTWPCLFV